MSCKVPNWTYLFSYMRPRLCGWWPGLLRPSRHTLWPRPSLSPGPENRPGRHRPRVRRTSQPSPSPCPKNRPSRHRPRVRRTVPARDVDPGPFSQSRDFGVFGKKPGISRDPGINVFFLIIIVTLAHKRITSTDVASSCVLFIPFRNGAITPHPYLVTTCA